jgi:predicted Fe-Mo cluster-binding NifX family protein
MKIAVPYKEGQVFQHFGKTKYFKVYEIKNDAINEELMIEPKNNHQSSLARLLYDLEVNILICGGIGGGARIALEKAGIQLYSGVKGNADDAVKALLEGTLIYDPDIKHNQQKERIQNRNDQELHDHNLNQVLSLGLSLSRGLGRRLRQNHGFKKGKNPGPGQGCGLAKRQGNRFGKNQGWRKHRHCQ